MAWTETISSREGSKDVASSAEAVRAFRVWGVQPFAIIDNPSSVLSNGATGTPLPVYGSSHPDSPALFLDRWDARPDGAVIDARALYSSDRRFSFPESPQNPSDPGYAEWAADIRHEVVDYVYSVREPTIVTTDILSTIINGWHSRKQPIDESRIVFSRRVTIPRALAGAAIAAMATQHKKLHRIPDLGNRVVLFNGGGTSPISATLYEARYSWTFDPGTPPPPPPDPDNPNDPPPPPPPNEAHPLPRASKLGTSRIPGTFLRPPYEVLLEPYSTDPTPNANPPAPTFTTVLPHAYSANGWQTLPGM